MSFCLDSMCYALASGWLGVGIWLLGFFVGFGALSLRSLLSRSRRESAQ